MKKSEIFAAVLGICADVCEVRSDSILQDLKYTAVVDARCLCVRLCRRLGLSNEDVALVVLRAQNPAEAFPTAQALKNKARTVSGLFTDYDERFARSYAFREMAREADRLTNEKLGR